MANLMKMAWHAIGRGRMNKDMQDAFERGQRIAAERGLPVKIKLEVTIHPPRKDDASYQPVAYSRTISEPAFKSKTWDMVRRGDIAVSDAEEAPEQLDLTLENTKPRLAVAGGERN